MISTLTSLFSRADHEDPDGEATQEADVEARTRGTDVPLLADAEEWIADDTGVVGNGSDGPDRAVDSGTVERPTPGFVESSSDHSEPTASPASNGSDRSGTDWEFVAGAVDRALDRDGSPAVTAAEPTTDETESVETERSERREPQSSEPPNSVAAALIAEIEAGHVDEAELDALRDALGIDGRTSVEVRLDRLQTQMADIEAYAAAFERFFDESGTPTQLTADLRTRIDGVNDHLDQEVSRLEAALDAQAETHAADVERLERRIEGTATALTDSVVALSCDVEELRDDVDAGAEWRTAVREALGASPSNSGQQAD